MQLRGEKGKKGKRSSLSKCQSTYSNSETVVEVLTVVIGKDDSMVNKIVPIIE